MAQNIAELIWDYESKVFLEFPSRQPVAIEATLGSPILLPLSTGKNREEVTIQIELKVRGATNSGANAYTSSVSNNVTDEDGIEVNLYAIQLYRITPREQ
ncbi:MAG: hypothetical protein Q8R18_03010 [bacterium]|nr:hypothetical protein [bacterium]